MKCFDWNRLDAREREDILQRPVQAVSEAVRSGVQAVFADVQARGDRALHDFTLRFDGVALSAFEVEAAEFDAAATRVAAPVQAAIAEAAGRIEAFHRAGMAAGYALETAPGLRCERVLRPIRRVGLYVPAGSAPLPSTALMLTIPARLAGCAEIILCTPPRKDGSADPAVLLAAQQAPGVRVFKLGGAQAIAAMALGSARIPRCDKLFGPGNGWVDEAKRQAAQRPGGPAIDMPAGPSEVLVIADAGANPTFVAADLLSQAEHGPDSQVILLSDSVELIERVEREVERQCDGLPRADIARQALAQSRLIAVDSLAQAVEVSNRYAPEHLILQVAEPRALLDGVDSAGSIFLGPWTPESVGDYCSGSNHVLPTYGYARSYSGVSVASYQKQISVQEVSADGLRRIGPCTATLAAAEQLEAHRRAVTLRLEALA